MVCLAARSIRPAGQSPGQAGGGQTSSASSAAGDCRMFRILNRRSTTMDAGYISAISALAGSAIGALASLTATWINTTTQTRIAQQLKDRARREALYGEFIHEASKLFADAFEHELGWFSSMRPSTQSASLPTSERSKKRSGSSCRSVRPILRQTRSSGSSAPSLLAGS